MKQASRVATYAAEFIGTFLLVFTMGCNAHTGSIGAALSVGCVVAATACSLGTVSGSHFNPAITLAVVTSGQRGMPAPDVVCYMLSQILGGTFGTFTCWILADKVLWQQPGYAYSSAQAFAVEVIYSWMLCYVSLNVMTADGRGGPSHTSNGLAVGSTITAAMVASGPISGCRLNPAVTLGSLCLPRTPRASGSLVLASLYVVAPLVGALISAASFRLTRGSSSGPHEMLDGDWPAGPAAQPLRAPPPTARSEAYLGRARAEDRGPPPWSVRLYRQSPLALPEAVCGHELLCGLHWQVRESAHGAVETCDVDLSCVKFGHGAECLGGVYFNDKDDFANGIHHIGGDVTGEAGQVDNEAIAFQLANVEANVHALLFTMMIYSSEHSFSNIQRCFIRLVDVSDGKKEFCRYQKESMKPGSNALIAAMLYRAGGRWCFKAVDESFTLPANSSFRKLIPQMSDSVLLAASGAVDEA